MRRRERFSRVFPAMSSRRRCQGFKSTGEGRFPALTISSSMSKPGWLMCSFVLILVLHEQDGIERHVGRRRSEQRKRHIRIRAERAEGGARRAAAGGRNHEA